MSRPFPNRPGLRRARSLALLALLLPSLTGCMYSFTGGGLPTHVRRVYIEPFENETPYQTLTSDLLREMQDRLPGSLGVRLSSQQTADAIVRGTLKLRRGADHQLRPQRRTPAAASPATRRACRSASTPRSTTCANDKVLWAGSSVTAIGLFDPGREDVDDGRRKALEEVVMKLIEGAQSQW